MKRFIGLLLSVCMLFSIFGTTVANAADYSGSCGDTVAWSLDTTDGTLAISGTGAVPNYDYIDAPWWFLKNQITKVVIGDGITHIGNYAFEGCTALADLVIESDDLLSVGTKAFFDCGQLGYNGVTLPNSIVSIGDYAFAGCYSLQINCLPSDLVTIGDWAFMSCGRLVQGALVIPDNVIGIGDGAFTEIMTAKSLYIPSGVVDIGSDAFVGCVNLGAISVAGDNRNYVAVDDVLYDYDMTELMLCPAGRGYDELVLPNSVVCIDDYAFYNAQVLSVVIPEGAEHIGFGAFSNSVIQNIVIPSSIVSIDDCAFEHCFSLENAYYCGTSENWDSIVSGLDNIGLADTVVNFSLSDLMVSKCAVALQSSLTMVLRVRCDAVDGIVDNVRIVATRNGKCTVLTDSQRTVSDGVDYYTFRYYGISPQCMSDEISFVVYGTTEGGNTVHGGSYNMSVRRYAMGLLGNIDLADPSSVDIKLATLLVDMLEYGACAQKYIGYKTNDLATAMLTDEQKNIGTATEPVCTDIRDRSYSQCAEGDRIFDCSATGLTLSNAIVPRIVFSAQSDVDLSDVSVRVKVGDNAVREYGYVDNSDSFVVEHRAGRLYLRFLFNDLNADNIAVPVYLTVYKNGVAVSDTCLFSVESYAAAVSQWTDPAYSAMLVLTTAMVNYGRSAIKYKS